MLLVSLRRRYVVNSIDGRILLRSLPPAMMRFCACDAGALKIENLTRPALHPCMCEANGKITTHAKLT